MFKRIVPALCLSLLMAPALSQTEPVAGDAAPEAAPEKILVVGQRPGPGLWKISKGENVLWVFGTYSPLPDKMEWRSHQVESILAQSQEFLAPPSTGISVGYGAVTALPFLVGIKNNPDGAQLRDVLPADVYARWQPLKAKYIGDNNGIERERPTFVADELFRKGLAHAGLSASGGVGDTIFRIATKNKIRITRTGVSVAIESPFKAVRAFKKSKLDDVRCFAKTVEQLESDIDAMRIRANAWAKGDIAVIQNMSFAERDEACSDAIMNSVLAELQPEILTIKSRARDSWLAAAEKSLAANKSTFAMLQMKDILDSKGLVAALEAKGYLVERPE